MPYGYRNAVSGAAVPWNRKVTMRHVSNVQANFQSDANAWTVYWLRATSVMDPFATGGTGAGGQTVADHSANGVAQWRNFYNRYIVRGFKVRATFTLTQVGAAGQTPMMVGMVPSETVVSSGNLPAGIWNLAESKAGPWKILSNNGPGAADSQKSIVLRLSPRRFRANSTFDDDVLTYSGNLNPAAGFGGGGNPIDNIYVGIFLGSLANAAWGTTNYPIVNITLVSDFAVELFEPLLQYPTWLTPPAAVEGDEDFEADFEDGGGPITGTEGLDFPIVEWPKL